MDGNEKWWLERPTDDQQAPVEKDDHRSLVAKPVPLPRSYQPYTQRPDYQPPADKRLAGWALGLSILPCFFLTQLVAVVLAIIVLVRSFDGREHGRGLAIAALCVSGTWILSLSFWIAFMVEDDPDRDLLISGETRATDLREDHCYQLPEFADNQELVSLRAVPCAEAHSAEVFRKFDLAGDDYPGRSGVIAMADEGCLGEAFAEFIGTPYDASVLDVYYLFPTERLWVFNERSVTCVVFDPTSPGATQGEQLTGTLRDAQR